MTRTLVVFARAPQLGRVKTRLARGIGMSAALAFYRRRLADLLHHVARDGRWRTVLAVTPGGAAATSRLWPRKLARHPQGAGDLGRRMGRVFRTFPPGQVCIIGADIPEITRARIWRAFRALGSADVVFGPAVDGGYWLIGAHRGRHLDLFADVRWSTRHALADTRANLKRRRVALIDRLADIDDAAAYRRWRRKTG